MPPVPYDLDKGAALHEDIGFLLSIARTWTSRRVNDALQPVGLRTRTYSVLTLAAESDGITQRAIADTLALNPSQIVAMVDDLAERELVERRAHADDRRARAISATADGVALQREARDRVESALADALHGLDEDRQQTLRELLQQIVGTAGIQEEA